MNNLFPVKKKKLSLVIPGIPQAKQSARHRIIKSGDKQFISSYQSKEVEQDKYNIRAIIIQQLEKDFIPFQKGVAVKITKLHHIFPPLTTFSKTKMDQIVNGILIPKTTKPDLTDNLNKGLFDAMEGIVYINDSQICAMDNLKKFYGFTPRIEIDLEEVDILE